MCKLPSTDTASSLLLFNPQNVSTVATVKFKSDTSLYVLGVKFWVDCTKYKEVLTDM